MELPAPSDGILTRIVKKDGDKVAVGEVIALIDPDGEPAPKSSGTKSQPTELKQATEVKQPAPQSPPASTDKPKLAKADLAPADEPVAAPSVRRLLREHHVSRPGCQTDGRGRTRPA